MWGGPYRGFVWAPAFAGAHIYCFMTAGAVCHLDNTQDSCESPSDVHWHGASRPPGLLGVALCLKVQRCHPCYRIVLASGRRKRVIIAVRAFADVFQLRKAVELGWRATSIGSIPPSHSPPGCLLQCRFHQMGVQLQALRPATGRSVSATAHHVPHALQVSEAHSTGGLFRRCFEGLRWVAHLRSTRGEAVVSLLHPSPCSWHAPPLPPAA